MRRTILFMIIVLFVIILGNDKSNASMARGIPIDSLGMKPEQRQRIAATLCATQIDSIEIFYSFLESEYYVKFTLTPSSTRYEMWWWLYMFESGSLSDVEISMCKNIIPYFFDYEMDRLYGSIIEAVPPQIKQGRELKEESVWIQVYTPDDVFGIDFYFMYAFDNDLEFSIIGRDGELFPVEIYQFAFWFRQWAVSHGLLSYDVSELKERDECRMRELLKGLSDEE